MVCWAFSSLSLDSLAILSKFSWSISLISSCLQRVFSFSFCLRLASLHSSSARQHCPLSWYSCTKIAFFFTGADSATFDLSIGLGEGMCMSGEVPSSWLKVYFYLSMLLDSQCHWWVRLLPPSNSELAAHIFGWVSFFSEAT